jgi:small nuclear ribonucleoprotein (snRNP)-like protein
MKKHLAILLVALIVTVLPRTAMAQTSDVEKTRAKVQTLSASRNQLVEVKFRDKTKVKGYITSVDPVSFTLRDAKTNASQSVAYSEVDNIGKANDGISTKTWLIVGGVAAGAVTTWLIVKPAVCDGGAQTRGIC